jgi:hypothetical protein
MSPIVFRSSGGGFASLGGLFFFAFAFGFGARLALAGAAARFG